MKSCVVSIGKEIISGSVLDSNANYISKRLTSLGFYNRYIVAVDDMEEDIILSIKWCLNQVDIIITTGGLGPTFDDITMNAISKVFGKKLVFNEEAYKHINEFYFKLFRDGKVKSAEINDKRKKMAYLPEKTIVIKNKVGASFGAFIKEHEKMVFVLPGVPKEMKCMLEDEIIPLIKPLSRTVTIIKVYEFNINDESVFGKIIENIDNKDNVYIKSLPVGFESNTMNIRFTATKENETLCVEAIERVRKIIQEKISRLNG